MSAEMLSQSDRVARGVAADILQGRRRPGSHLNEQQLADTYEVSRTPVREAIKYLSSEGLVELRPRRGAFVAKISVEKLIRMFEAAAELEAVCTRLACRRMTVRDTKELRDLHESCRQFVEENDAASYYEESLNFHRLIFRGAQNEVLEEMAVRLFDRLAPFRRRQIFRTGRIAASFAEHEAILTAIEAGDEERATQLMQQHTGKVEGSVVDMIAALDGGD